MKKRYVLAVIACIVITLFWNLVPFPHGLSRYSWRNTSSFDHPVSTAVNVYCRKHTVPDITFEQSTWNEGWLNVLKAKLSEDAILQLDYAGEEPENLDQIENPMEGWRRVCGINGGFFNAHEPEYGRPTGCVRTDGAFAQWNGNELTPAYGSGNVTVYFNKNGHLRFAYHGWGNGQWMPLSDTTWSYNDSVQDYSYHIEEQYGVSGAYALLVHGKRCFLGRPHSHYWYASDDSAVTLFGETADGTILMVTAEHAGGGLKECELMESLGAVNAIRMDGSYSTGMVVDKGLVNHRKN